MKLNSFSTILLTAAVFYFYVNYYKPSKLKKEIKQKLKANPEVNNRIDQILNRLTNQELKALHNWLCYGIGGPIVKAISKTYNIL